MYLKIFFFHEIGMNFVLRWVWALVQVTVLESEVFLCSRNHWDCCCGGRIMSVFNINNHLHHCHQKTFSKIIIINCYYCYCCCFCSSRWWYLLLGLLVLRPYPFQVYYKVRQVLLPSCDSLFYYEVWCSVITKCDSFFVTKCDGYYKVGQLLQSATEHTRPFRPRPRMGELAQNSKIHATTCIDSYLLQKRLPIDCSIAIRRPGCEVMANRTSLLCSVIVHRPGGQNATITRHRN